MVRQFQHVEADLIRVHANEVTYPLHVMLRYRLERAMIRRATRLSATSLATRDLLRTLAPGEVDQRTGQAVVDHGGAEDAGNDGQGFFETCSQDKGQQLGLVANLGQREAQ
mgnify:CR=1 FL=1